MNTILDEHQLSLGKKRWHLLKPGRIGDILSVLAANRNITDLKSFLEPDFETHLHNPFLLPDMEHAVEIIRQIQQEQRKVMIVGDYDADGITGTALLYEMFKAIGVPDVIARLPHRIHDGYGCQPHIIQEAIRDHVDLVVTVDNGVSSYDAVTLAKEHGIKFIICDHHTTPETLPPADAILHPKLETCQYPFRDLTGVGVAFKLAQAVCPRLLSSHEAEKFLKWSLDIVSIGTVADCATVLGENRVLIKYGLIVLSKTRRPGLQQVLRQCLGNSPTYDTVLIGFRIAPRINAAGRLSHADTSLKLLTTRDTIEAELLAQELQNLNAKRQERTMQAVEQAKQQIWQDILSEKILIAKNKDWHPGIVGLIAGRLTEEYHRPSVIFHQREEDGVLVASARSIAQFNIIQAITQQKDLLLRFGGHSQAAGCSLKPEHYQAFRENMQQLANAGLTDDNLHPTIEIDCELQPDQMTLALKQEIDTLEPYGIGNERPVFLLSDLTVQTINPVGKNGSHVQLWLRTAEGKTIKGIAFQQGYLAKKLTTGQKVKVACSLQVNQWNGTSSLEIEVVDVRRNT